MCVSTNVFTCTHENEYDVLTSVSTRTYDNEYTHLLECLRVITEVVARTEQWNLTKTRTWFYALLVPPLKGLNK